VRFSVNTRVLYTLLSALIVILGSFVAIRFAQGYRPTKSGFVQGTGLLVANSFPPGAEIFVNSKLVSATDDTLNLEPGSYDVEIIRDGYTPWKKKVQVESELVTQTNAQLFRKVASLTPLTSTGVQNISPSPDGQKLIFSTSSASAQTKNGLYLLDLSNGLLANQREARQIAEQVSGFDLTTAEFIWSPDNTEVILSSNNKDVLLDLSKKNALSALPDISFKKKQILSEWESQLYLRERQFFDKFPNEMLVIATQSAKNIYLSPDKKKILYTATASATIPEGISPPLPARSTQAEERTILPGQMYVYDREEDKNFPITVDQGATSSASKVLLASDLFDKDPKKLTSSPSSFLQLQASTSAQTAKNFAAFYSSLYSTGVQWFPDSKHLFFTNKDKIYILEYDNTNQTEVYSGPFSDNFVYPWPDGSKLLILTSFSANSPLNLYGIELK
jgi:hypothetical protein